MFCQLEMLRLCLRSRVRLFLNELPDSLDETYERILKGIHKTNRSYVRRLLQCMAVAIRPLRVEELAQILNSNLDADWQSEDQEQELLSACPSMIIIADSDGSRVVQFSHFSVKEFLTSDRLATSREDIMQYHIIPEAAHTTLARASFAVLLRLDGRVLRSNAMSIPLANYAAEYWVSHTQVGNVSSRVMGPMKTLFDSAKPHFSAWLRIYDIDRPFGSRPPENTTPQPLYYSALCGFYDLVEHLVNNRSQDINAIGGHHDYPLIAALHGGYIQVAELLFQHGANIDVQGTDKQTPLHRALGWQNSSAVTALQFLLKHGVDVTAQRKDLWTPLHLVAARGDFEVAQTLLERNMDVKSWNVDDETAVYPVPKPTFPRSEGNHPNLVQPLLYYGTDVNSRDNKGATPLHGASLRGSVEVVRALLDHGAHVNAEDNWGRTPLHRVLGVGGYSDECRFSVAQLLIAHGADVNAQDKYDGTPLHLVPYFLDLKLVRMLIDRGANVNARNNQDQTPLHRALRAEDYSCEDRFLVAHLLVERGADVNARDACDETPLNLATYFLELKLVQMLVNHGANVNVNAAEDGQGQTPLHRALEANLNGFTRKDRFDIVQLFVEHDADVNARDENHKTPLHLASHSLELGLVRILLDHGTNINAEDNWGRTPLHLVLETQGRCNVDRFSIAQSLVKCGAETNARDERGQTPLHLAPNFLDIKLVRMLIDHGANVNAEDNQGRTPLHRVLEARGHSDEDRFCIAQLLVECGADVNAQDNYKATPLHLAPYFLDLKLVRMLVDHGANVHAEDNQGWTPLYRVLRSRGHHDDEDLFGVALQLMDNGADVNAPHGNHETLLHLACYHLELELARMLLDLGACVNAEDHYSQTPLHVVSGGRRFADKGRSGVAQLLMEHGVDVNARHKNHESLFHLASYSLELELERMLVDRGANVNAEDNHSQTTLHRVSGGKIFADEDRSGLAQLLMERGADVNAQNGGCDTPLHLAFNYPDLKLVRILVDRGANVNATNLQGQTPLHRMLRNENYSNEDRFSLAQLLISHGTDVNAQDDRGQTALHLAPCFWDLNLVRMLVARGANVNVEDNHGETPLLRVSGAEVFPNEDCFRVAQLLLECGADVDRRLRGENHETLLHRASYFLELKLVRMLVDYGANVNAEDNLGRTPLHRVSEDSSSYKSDMDRFGVAQHLMEHGAYANIPDKYRETPLHLASRLVSLDVVWILLKHGADLHVENEEGKIPFQLAQDSMKEDMKRSQLEYIIRRARRVQGVALMSLLYGCESGQYQFKYSANVICEPYDPNRTRYHLHGFHSKLDSE